MLGLQVNALHPLRQHPLMHRLCVVRGAGQCKLLITHGKVRGSAAFNQWYCLERLKRGSWKYQCLDIAKLKHHITIRPDGDSGAPMSGLKPLVAKNINDDRIQRDAVFIQGQADYRGLERLMQRQKRRD